MTIKYIGKTKRGSYDKLNFTYDKHYEVLADYRNRVSGQNVPDNGFVIKNDEDENVMVFMNNFVITDNNTANTFVFLNRRINNENNYCNF